MGNRSQLARHLYVDRFSRGFGNIGKRAFEIRHSKQNHSKRNLYYGNSNKVQKHLIITMAIQLIAVILISVGRITSRTAQYDYDKARTIFFVLTLLAVLVEIGAITYYLVMRNNLLNKYPTSTALDKQYINRLLWCTYPLVFAVMLVFVIYHGLEFYEQIITALIFGVLFVIPFVLGYFWNKKR